MACATGAPAVARYRRLALPADAAVSGAPRCRRWQPVACATGALAGARYRRPALPADAAAKGALRCRRWPVPATGVFKPLQQPDHACAQHSSKLTEHPYPWSTRTAGAACAQHFWPFPNCNPFLFSSILVRLVLQLQPSSESVSVDDGACAGCRLMPAGKDPRSKLHAASAAAHVAPQAGRAAGMLCRIEGSGTAT